MRMYLAIAALLALIAAPGAAAADEPEPATDVRSDKRFLVGASPVDMFRDLDYPFSITLSTLRFSMQVTPRIGLDLSVGKMLFDEEQDVTDILFSYAGVRGFLSDGTWAPYLFARAGGLIVYDEVESAEAVPFAAAGGGLEYTHDSGVSVWAELGLGVIFSPLLYGNVGVGYRFAGLGG